MPSRLEFGKGRKTLLILEKMLNELIGIINPDDKEFSEEIAAMIYKCIMKIYLENETSGDKVK